MSWADYYDQERIPLMKDLTEVQKIRLDRLVELCIPEDFQQYPLDELRARVFNLLFEEGLFAHESGLPSQGE